MTAAPARATGGSVSGNTQSSPEARLLVVDDEPNIRELLSASLRYAGFEVATAADGQQALALADTFRPDLLVLDVMMPGLDGFDTMRIVRQLEGYKSVPIVAVTAKAMVGDREKCIEAGASDYIAKPVNVDVLLATLWRTVQQPA
jgi:two-component system, OmpR family, response regulator